MSLEKQFDFTKLEQSIYKNWEKSGCFKPVKNSDLWKELDNIQKKHLIDWRWVRGHSGHEEAARAVGHEGGQTFACSSCST